MDFDKIISDNAKARRNAKTEAYRAENEAHKQRMAALDALDIPEAERYRRRRALLVQWAEDTARATKRAAGRHTKGQALERALRAEIDSER